MAPQVILGYLPGSTKKPKGDENVDQVIGGSAPPSLVSQQEAPQLQSSFFSKLPYEIRTSIYRKSIQLLELGNTLHIVTDSQLTRADPYPWMSNDDPSSVTEDRLAYVPCAAGLGDPFQISSTHYGYWPRGHLACGRIASWKTASPYDGPPRPKNYTTSRTYDLALLLSCKRMYTEVSDLLYSTIRFDGLGLIATSRFLTSISPHHLRLIRRFSLTWKTSVSVLDPPLPANLSELERIERLENNRTRLWTQVCESIKKMTSLQELYVSIYISRYRPSSEIEILDPLLHIRNVEKESYTVALQPIDVENSRPEDVFTGEADTPFSISRSLQGSQHDSDMIYNPYVEGIRPRSAWSHLCGELLFVCCLPYLICSGYFNDDD